MKRFALMISLLLSILCMTQAKDRIVERPPFLAQSSSSIEIDKIVMSDTVTTVYIKAFYRPKYWIKIATGSVLKDNNGNLYPIRKGIGITLDKEFWMPESGEAEFQLTFPPIPQNVTCLDFSEGDFEGAYKIWGIQLDKKTFSKFKLPKDVTVTKADHKTTLPEPVVKYAKAILKGRILDYQKGMPNKGSLYFQDVIRDEAQEGKIRIQDDGTFYHEMNVFMVTPCMIRFPFGAVSYLLAPGETTSVVINLRENARKQSHLRQAEKPYGKEIYYGGYLAGVQQELADHPMSFSFTEGNSYEEYQQQIKKLNGKTAEEYKAQILARLPEFRKQITQSKGSPAYKEIINTDLELSAALKIIETERNLKLVHIMTNGLEGEKANKYYAETKIDIPQGYYESLQEFTYILSPKASYNSRYPILFDIIRRIGIDDKILKSLSNHTATGYLIQNLKAQMIGVSMRDLNPLNDKQKAELATMPAAYNEMALAMNNDLLKQIEINKKKTGFTVNETGEVSNEDLFPSIISKFRGHTLLVDFWATWCGPCRSANKQILPMKKELKDKDIFYLYITGETSPLGTWKNMIPDIHGEHFRVTDEQWSYLREKFSIRGVPTYFVIDKEGNITYKQTGFPGVDTMKEQLMKALEK